MFSNQKLTLRCFLCHVFELWGPNQTSSRNWVPTLPQEPEDFALGGVLQPDAVHYRRPDAVGAAALRHRRLDDGLAASAGAPQPLEVQVVFLGLAECHAFVEEVL